MNGLAATEYIMAHCPTPILVVSASINRGELFKIYEALAAGAVDVLEKPDGLEPDGNWQRRFLAAVKLVARIRVITHPRARLTGMASERTGPATPAKETERANRVFDLVAIGASTGGPGAIFESPARPAATVQPADFACAAHQRAVRIGLRGLAGRTGQPLRELCAGRNGGHGRSRPGGRCAGRPAFDRSRRPFASHPRRGTAFLPAVRRRAVRVCRDRIRRVEPRPVC